MSSKHAKLEPAEPDFRMVLVGKTGAGKSSSGNTILGRRAFKSAFSAAAVTPKCQKEEVEFEGKLLAVVDTPGLFDTKKIEKEIAEEIVRCISHIAPGPHVFLVVIQLNRFTKEEQQTIKLIQTMFGEEAARYTMVLFTRGDDLEDEGMTMKKFLRTNKELRDFIRQYGGRYHVFNNRTNRNQNLSQVRELLEKINTMVQNNGGRFYTSKMLEEVERAIKEEMKRLLRENPGMSPEEARRQAERNNKFIVAVLTAVGGAAGAVVGAAGGVAATATASAGAVAGAGAAGGAASGATVGSIGGPVGAAAGALVGVGVGLAVAGIVIAVKDDKCVLQ